MSDISQIDGQSVRLKRETLGWAVTDMATLACLSVKQIKQIEEGGTSAFYSESVKLTAARKVAALLNMTDAQLFGQKTPVTVEPAFVPDTANASLAQSAFANPESTALADTPHAALARSEALHELAQPPEHIDTAPLDSSAHVSSHAEVSVQPAQAMVAEEASPNPSQASAQPAGNGGYMLKIFALFLVALAVAAFLRPKAGEDKPEQETAAPPPVQVPGANDNTPNTSEQPAAANAAVASQPATADKPVESVAPSGVADKAATPAASDKPAPGGTEKSSPPVVNPATNPANSTANPGK